MPRLNASAFLSLGFLRFAVLKVKDFLETMPKGALKVIHENLLGKQGIISNVRLLQECATQIENIENLSLWYDTLKTWQKKVLTWIAMSQNRGVSRAELSIALRHELNEELAIFLQEACERVAIFRAESFGVFAYYSFTDFADFFVKVDKSEITGRESWFSNENKVLWLLIRLCSLIVKGELRINNNLDLHRRTQMQLQEMSAMPEFFSVEKNDYWLLLLQFCSDSSWLEVTGSVVGLADHAFEEISVHPQRLVLNILDWWAKLRLDGNLGILQHLFANQEQSISIVSAQNLFWATDPQNSNPDIGGQEVEFSRLNKILQEMWVLGIVEFSIRESSLDQVRLTRRGYGWVYNSVDELEVNPLAATSMPNFELLIPAMSNPAYLMVASSVGEILAEDEFIRIVVNKEDYIAGLKTNIPKIWFDNFYQWINLPPNMQETLASWYQILFGSWIRTLQILRIYDENKWEELNGFSAFKDCVIESIPNWGFILHDLKVKKARELLENFGLTPPDFNELANQKTQKFKKGDWSQKVAIARFKDGKIDYEPNQKEDLEQVVSPSLQKSKYGTEFQELAGLELNNVLRYASLMDIPVEIEYYVGSGKRKEEISKTVLIKEVFTRREPCFLQGNCSSGESIEIHLDNISRFRLTKI